MIAAVCTLYDVLYVSMRAHLFHPYHCKFDMIFDHIQKISNFVCRVLISTFYLLKKKTVVIY